VQLAHCLIVENQVALLATLLERGYLSSDSLPSLWQTALYHTRASSLQVILERTADKFHAADDTPAASWKPDAEPQDIVACLHTLDTHAFPRQAHWMSDALAKDHLDVVRYLCKHQYPIHDLDALLASARQQPLCVTLLLRHYRRSTYPNDRSAREAALKMLYDGA
jgi:hypothetical protein